MNDALDRFLLCYHDPAKRRWIVYASAKDKAEARDKELPDTRIFDNHEGEFIS